MDPMLATPGPLPAGEDWTFEVKFDGIRLIADTTSGRTRLLSRNGRDLTGAFPELHPLADVGQFVLDGELVARAGGPPTLQALAPRIHRSTASAAVQAACPISYIVFDVLSAAGRDVTGQPLTRRREILRSLLQDCLIWQVADVFDDGPALWRATRDAGLEGVVAKRRDSVYRAGTRSRDWVKTVHRTSSDLVVIGWRPETGSRSRVGSLVLARPGPQGGLAYVGSAGSGLTRDLSDALMGVFPTIEIAGPAVAVPENGDPQTRWVEPVLVVSITHLGESTGGRLRQPVVTALRPDLTADDLVATQPQAGGE